jgi:hypothetical protein
MSSTTATRSLNDENAAENAAPTDGTAASPTKKAKTKQQSPHDLYFEELEAVFRRDNVLGRILIRGIARTPRGDNDDDDDDESDEEEEQDNSKFTSAQMQDLRFVAVTKERADAIDQMEQLLLGDQAGSSFMMFNTSFSYQVLGVFEHLKKLLTGTKSWTQKFNLLFAFTSTIDRYDVWMHDHEGGWGGEIMLKALATRWKNVLKKTDAELGTDPEYTRPGVICFLEKFKKTVEDIDTYEEPKIKFNF